MAAVNILVFCLLVLYLSVCFKEEIVDVLPMAACILVLVLYPLAFLQRLSWIDWIGPVLAAFLLLWLFKRDSGVRRQILSEIKRKLLHPGVFLAVLVLAGGAVLAGGKLAGWWDDINFWAADVKALYALDGFAAKYTNAASEFGDYPPGAQLMKWWFVHLSPGLFREGLMFAGYYFMIFVFFMPLFRNLRKKNPFLIIGCAVILWALPSVAEAFYLRGMCADLIMAAVYGAYLSAVMDEEGRSERFYYMRLSLYLAVLVLIKSVGFLWAVFGILFFVIYRTGQRRLQKNAGLRKKELFGPALLITAAPLAAGGTWLAFCFFMRRVAKLTGAAVSIAAGNSIQFLPGMKEKLLSAFGEAFLFWPLHRSSTPGLDFSPAAMLVFICVMPVILYKTGFLKKFEALTLGIFLPVSGLIFYGINLAGHLTIFATEAQYLDPYAMVSSIERYGVPFTVGSLSLLCFLLLNRRKEPGRDFVPKRSFLREYGPLLLIMIFVAISAQWQEVYYCLGGYREEIGRELEIRKEMITPASDRFLKTVQQIDAGSGMRVLYFKYRTENLRVENAYTAFEASPVSLIYASLDLQTMNSGDILNAIASSHAGYLYADEIPEGTGKLFEPFTKNFTPGILYRIVSDNGNVRLEPFQE